MKEIVFRGKRADNGEWVYGWYAECCFGSWPLLPAIIPIEEARAGHWQPREIIPETLEAIEE